MLVVVFLAVWVLISIYTTNTATSVAGAHFPSKDSHEPIIYQWKDNCTESCSCLPPIFEDTSEMIYFHSSYKTTDRNMWPPGWNVFYNEWLRLHSTGTPKVVHLLWLDEHNALLSKCSDVGEKYDSMGSFIEKADFSRALYMAVYGGLYHDMDYCPLLNSVAHLNGHYPDGEVLLQGRQPGANAKLAMEFVMSRRPNHPFWVEYVSAPYEGAPYTPDLALYGPGGLSGYYESYIQRNGTNGIIVVSPDNVTPIEWNGIMTQFNFTSCSQDVLLRRPDEDWIAL